MLRLRNCNRNYINICTTAFQPYDEPPPTTPQRQIHITTGTNIKCSLQGVNEVSERLRISDKQLNTIIFGCKNALSLLLNLVFKPEFSDCMF